VDTKLDSLPAFAGMTKVEREELAALDTGLRRYDGKYFKPQSFP
jgi:hypothetical protein